MADVIITSYDTTAYTIGSGDDYVLLEGVTHFSSSGNPLNITSSGGNTIIVAGTMIAAGSSQAIVGSLFSTDDVNITVTQTGSIFADGDLLAIRTNGNYHILNNYGVIQGGVGVDLSGDDVTVINTGLIISNHDGSSDLYAVVLDGDRVFLDNSGTISGHYGVLIDEDSHLINSGTITAKETAVFLDNAFTTDTSTLVNSGSITSANGEAVKGDLGTQNLRNSGLISGDVNLEGGNDSYRGKQTGVTQGVVDGGTGNDTLFGARGDDELSGGEDNDQIRGKAGDDILGGGTGNDELRGGGGDDQITGGEGKDVMFGGTGADIFVFDSAADAGTGGAGRDKINDFSRSDDLIDFSGMGLSFLGTGGFTGTADELRLRTTSNGNTIIEIDSTGDGNADTEISIRGASNLGEVDFLL